MRQSFNTAIIFGTLLILVSACKPSQKDPPFDFTHSRQDVKADGANIKADNPLAIIGAPFLWKTTTGKNPDGSRVRVAVVGTGIDYTIPDLRDALWINPGEADEAMRKNGQDNDKNGYRNDVFGYDFFSGDEMPYDWHGHDTFTASIIAATGATNPDVIGVAPNADLVIARYIGPDGRGKGLDAVEALKYAVKVNAKVIYFNWPQGGFPAPESILILQEFKKAGEQNLLVVVPAGNSANHSVPTFVKEAGKMSNVVVVAGIGPDGRLKSDSNSGKSLATIAAPAVNATGYFPGGEISHNLTTTSVAAAYVAGAAALIATLPGMGSAERIKSELLSRGVLKKDGEGLDVLSDGSVYLGKF